MDGSNPALTKMAGLGRSLTEDVIQSIARINLAIHERCIRKRFPRIELDVSVSNVSVWYGQRFPYGDVSVPGESISVVVSQAGKTLAKKNYSSFPDKVFPSAPLTLSFVDAKEIHGEELLVELLNNAEFTQQDLAELTLSVIPELRFAAVRKITDQTLLAKIAIEDKTRNVRIAAFKELSDQALLAQIAVDIKEKNIRLVAVGKVTDQMLLRSIAAGDKDSDVREAAISNLTDQSLLTKIAVEDTDEFDRRAAIRKLTDQALLARITLDDEILEVRQVASRKVTNQSLLAKIAVESKDSTVRIITVDGLSDQLLLSKIAAEDKDSDVRRQAAERLSILDYIQNHLK
jgi:hypothetical protein